MDPLKLYLLLKIWIFQPAMLVYQRVRKRLVVSFFVFFFLDLGEVIHASCLHVWESPVTWNVSRSFSIPHRIHGTGIFCLHLPQKSTMHGDKIDKNMDPMGTSHILLSSFRSHGRTETRIQTKVDFVSQFLWTD